MIKVLMIGPARNVQGGMTTVIDNYYLADIEKKVDLKYIETINDKNRVSKLLKEISGFYLFKKNISNFDIVHIHMAARRSAFRKSKYVRIAKKHNKKIIVHMHAGMFKVFFEKLNNKKKKYIIDSLKMADKIIVLSEEWKSYYSSIIDSSKIMVLHNSIIIPKDFKKDLDNNDILFLGKIRKEKGIYDLLEVVKKLVIKYPNVKLFIGGSGEEDTLRNIILQSKLSDNIKFLGWVDGKKKEELLRNCSIFILPSYYEAMPMSVLEAMAYKCVTISTNVGGIPKIIQNNKNGYLIEPGDKKELYLKIEEIFKDAEKRKILSNNGRKTIENNFDLNNMMNCLIDVYNQLLI